MAAPVVIELTWDGSRLVWGESAAEWAESQSGGVFRRVDGLPRVARRSDGLPRVVRRADGLARVVRRSVVARVVRRGDGLARVVRRGGELSRVFRRVGDGPMAILETELRKDADESRTFAFDFSRMPEIRQAGETISSATVPSVSGLTIGSPSVLAADFDGVPSGQGVKVVISGGTASTTYTVECRATTSGGSVVVAKGSLVVE